MHTATLGGDPQKAPLSACLSRSPAGEDLTSSARDRLADGPLVHAPKLPLSPLKDPSMPQTLVVSLTLGWGRERLTVPAWDPRARQTDVSPVPLRDFQTSWPLFPVSGHPLKRPARWADPSGRVPQGSRQSAGLGATRPLRELLGPGAREARAPEGFNQERPRRPGRGGRSGPSALMAPSCLSVSLCLHRLTWVSQLGTGTHTALPTGAAGEQKSKVTKSCWSANICNS